MADEGALVLCTYPGFADGGWELGSNAHEPVSSNY